MLFFFIPLTFIQIERMTFSDPTTVTLDLDLDTSSSKRDLASHHIVMGQAVFADRWGRTEGLQSDMSYVDLHIKFHCGNQDLFCDI